MAHWLANPRESDRRDISAEERLAIAETEIKFIKNAVGEMAADVKKIERALTTAAGVKLALMAIGAGITFAISQIWHYLDFRGLK
jgi:hypothetical protein